MICDAADTPAADGLRGQLIAAGAEECATDATVLLLLTNRTRLDWLREHVANLPASLITVVATGIGLRDEVSELWRRQWIDARRWQPTGPPLPVRRTTPISGSGVPLLPEALTQPIRPPAVNQAYHLATSLGVLLWVAGMAAHPTEPDAPATIEEALRLAWLLATLAASVAWLRASHRLVARDTTGDALLRSMGRLGPWVVILGLGNLGLYWVVAPEPVRAVLCVPIVLAVPIVLIRPHARLHFWFPASSRPAGEIALAPSRYWGHTVLVLLAHALVWIAVLNPDM